MWDDYIVIGIVTAGVAAVVIANIWFEYLLKSEKVETLLREVLRALPKEKMPEPAPRPEPDDTIRIQSELRHTPFPGDVIWLTLDENDLVLEVQVKTVLELGGDAVKGWH